MEQDNSVDVVELCSTCGGELELVADTGYWFCRTCKEPKLTKTQLEKFRYYLFTPMILKDKKD